MLIPREMLIKATELSLNDIKQALDNSGYTEQGYIRSADFVGQNIHGAFVYRITFPDDSIDDAYAVGNVYVKIQDCSDPSKPRFVADY
jgi:hypothetical protein